MIVGLQAWAFEEGYSIGYKAINGDSGIMPVTPIAPIPAIGSNEFREGIKQGVEAAQDSVDIYDFEDEE